MIFKNQMELFNFIWDTRDHVSEVSGKTLLPKGHSQWHWQFAHIIPKGLYGKFKLRMDNIALLTPEEHTQWDTKQYEIAEMWDWQYMFTIARKLKQEYHNAK